MHSTQAKNEICAPLHLDKMSEHIFLTKLLSQLIATLIGSLREDYREGGNHYELHVTHKLVIYYRIETYH